MYCKLVREDRLSILEAQVFLLKKHFLHRRLKQKPSVQRWPMKLYLVFPKAGVTQRLMSCWPKRRGGKEERAICARPHDNLCTCNCYALGQLWSLHSSFASHLVIRPLLFYFGVLYSTHRCAWFHAWFCLLSGPNCKCIIHNHPVYSSLTQSVCRHGKLCLGKALPTLRAPSAQGSASAYKFSVYEICISFKNLFKLFIYYFFILSPQDVILGG